MQEDDSCHTVSSNYHTLALTNVTEEVLESPE